MKYSHTSKSRKSCPHDPDHRTQLGLRLRSSRMRLGWSMADAAKYFQVTERTWHNWESGAHRIPFAVYKLCRVLSRFELPDAAWAGWSFQGGKLVTPEGRLIEPRDASWWSLMVRNAQAFSRAYREVGHLRCQLAAVIASGTTGMDSAAGASMHGGPGAGLVPYKTSLTIDPKTNNGSSQNDVIMTPWPTLYDYPTPLTPLHAPKPITLESASTPSFAWPWTPICGVRLSYQRPKPGPHLVGQTHLKQAFQNLSATNPDHLASWVNPSRPSSPEQNASGFTTSASTNQGPDSVSARPAAAGAATLASTARGAA